MSDPVTNVEIEDVLSSIRRLVSTDDRASQDGAEARDEQAAAPASEEPVQGADALVLTPALRVSGEEARTAEAAEEPAGDEADAPLELSAEDEIAREDDSHDAPDPQTDSWDEDMGDPDDSASDAQHATELEHIAEADDGSPQPDDGGAEAAAEDAPEQAEESADHWQDEAEQDAVEALSDRVAGFEAAVAARDDDWEPDGDATGNANAAEPTEPFNWQDDIEDAEVVSPTEGLDTFVAEEDDFAPEAAAPEPQPLKSEENGFLAEDDPLGDDAAVLDEEALRDLVTDIVRQELQGSLGERITRNVRKLVRREIHRALATKELE